jgi:O-antigen/teichoic acid export membrane protein
MKFNPMPGVETSGTEPQVIRRGVSGVFYNYLGRFASQLIGLLVSVYIIRALSVEVYGQYSLLFSILAYVGIIILFGLTNVFQRYIPELEEKKQITGIIKILGWGIGANLISGLVAVVLLWIISGWLGHLLQFDDLLLYIPIFGGVIILNAASSLLEVALNSLFHQLITNLSMLVFSITRFIGFYIVLHHNLTLYRLIEVELFAILLRFSLLAANCVIEMSKLYKMERLQNKNSDIRLPRVARFAFWSYLIELGGIFFNTDTDNFVISNYLGSEAVGAYAFANKVAAILSNWSPITVSANVIAPLFYGRYAQNNNELDRMFGLLCRAVYIFYIPILIFTIVVNKQFVNVLFGTKYLTASWLLVGVLAFLTFNAYQYPLGLATYAIEKNQISFYARIFSIYNLLMDLLVVRFWGITGIMFATGTAMAFKNLFTFYYVNKQVKLTWDWGAYLKILANSLAMGALAWLLRNFITNLLSLAIVILCGLLVYVVMTFINNCFTKDEMAIMKRIVQQVNIPILKKII